MEGHEKPARDRAPDREEYGHDVKPVDSAHHPSDVRYGGQVPSVCDLDAPGFGGDVP